MTGEDLTRPERAVGASAERGTAAQEERLSVDGVLRLLGNQRRCAMLRYLMNHPTETVSVDAPVDVVVAAETASTAGHQRTRERTRVSARCVQLPYPTKADIVASEADTDQIRYQGVPASKRSSSASTTSIQRR